MFRWRHMPVPDLFWVLSSRESCFIPMRREFPEWTVLLPDKEVQLVFPAGKVCNTRNLPAQNLHSFTAWGGELRLPFLEHFLTSFSINSNWNVTLCHLMKWLADRNIFFSCFVKKSFCFQLRTTLGRCLQTDNTTVFEELYFHQGFFSGQVITWICI